MSKAVQRRRRPNAPVFFWPTSVAASRSARRACWRAAFQRHMVLIFCSVLFISVYDAMSGGGALLFLASSISALTYPQTSSDDCSETSSVSVELSDQRHERVPGPDSTWEAAQLSVVVVVHQCSISRQTVSNVSTKTCLRMSGICSWEVLVSRQSYCPVNLSFSYIWRILNAHLVAVSSRRGITLSMQMKYNAFVPPCCDCQALFNAKITAWFNNAKNGIILIW